MFLCAYRILYTYKFYNYNTTFNRSIWVLKFERICWHLLYFRSSRGIPMGGGKYCSATGCMSGTIWADFWRYVIYLFCFPRGVQVTKYSEDWTLKIEIQNLLWSLSISYPSSRRAVEIISRFSSPRCLHDFRWLLCSTQMMSVDLAACLRLRRRLSLAAVRRAAETLDTHGEFHCEGSDLCASAWTNILFAHEFGAAKLLGVKSSVHLPVAGCRRFGLAGGERRPGPATAVCRDKRRS